jgi:hypothetical protein
MVIVEVVNVLWYLKILLCLSEIVEKKPWRNRSPVLP